MSGLQNTWWLVGTTLSNNVGTLHHAQSPIEDLQQTFSIQPEP